MKWRTLMLLTLLLTLGPSVAMSSPPGPAEEAATGKCHDLGGKAAKIGLDPVNQGGASAIEVHEGGASLREIPTEGIPFEWMEGGRACYINGLIPSNAADGRKIYAVVIETTGEVVRIANCSNRIRTTFRFKPAEPTIKTVEVEKIVEREVRVPCPECPALARPHVRRRGGGKGFWCTRNVGHFLVCLIPVGVGAGFALKGGGHDEPAKTDSGKKNRDGL